MENDTLPTIRRGAGREQELQDLTGQLESFFPTTLSKKAAKRDLAVREETYLRVVILKGHAIVEKLAADYRFAAKHYEITRVLKEIDYYLSLLDQPRSKAGQNYAEQIVKTFIHDLYTFVIELTQTMDENTRRIYEKDLFPEDEAERSWLQGIGLFLSK